MSAIYPQPSPVRYLSAHSLDQYAERVNEYTDNVAHGEIWRMVKNAALATKWQLSYFHIRIDWEATYYLYECYDGMFVIVVKAGCLVTLFKSERR